MELPNEDNYYGYIYCTTNLVNGMKYLGKHEKHKGKWDGVRKYDRPDNNYYLGSGTLLMRAIKKYGKENFEKDILQYCIDAKDLSESETYWGEYFGVKKSDLFYNIAETGTGGYLGEDIYKDLSVKRKQWYKEGKITGNVFKPGIGSKPFAHKISAAKKGKPWSEKRRKALSKPVVQLDENKNLIKIWDSATEPRDYYINELSWKGEITCRANQNKEGYRKLSKNKFYWMYLKDYERIFGR